MSDMRGSRPGSRRPCARNQTDSGHFVIRGNEVIYQPSTTLRIPSSMNRTQIMHRNEQGEVPVKGNRKRWL